MWAPVLLDHDERCRPQRYCYRRSAPDKCCAAGSVDERQFGTSEVLTLSGVVGKAILDRRW